MKKIIRYGFISLIYFLLYLPLVILLVYSLNSSKYSLLWQNASFKWYQELFQNRNLWTSFFHSVGLGLTVAFVTTTLSFFSSLHLFLFTHNKKYLNFLLLLLIIIPDLVLGVALLLFFNTVQLPLGFFSLFIAHVTFCIPFVIITLNSRIQTLDKNIYFAALDLGASHFFALVKVLLPLLWPAILSAFILGFTLSFDDVIVSYFVAGPDFNLLPLTVYSLIRSGITPELNALCSITFIFSITLVIIAYRGSKISV